MDGRTLAGYLKAKGLKAIKKTSTIIHGYNNFSRGDYRIETEKSFGIYSYPDGKKYPGKYVRRIYSTDQSKPVIKNILAELNEHILAEYGNEIVIPD